MLILTPQHAYYSSWPPCFSQGGISRSSSFKRRILLEEAEECEQPSGPGEVLALDLSYGGGAGDPYSPLRARSGPGIGGQQQVNCPVSPGSGQLQLNPAPGSPSLASSASTGVRVRMSPVRASGQQQPLPLWPVQQQQQQLQQPSVHQHQPSRFSKPPNNKKGSDSTDAAASPQLQLSSVSGPAAATAIDWRSMQPTVEHGSPVTGGAVPSAATTLHNPFLDPKTSAAACEWARSLAMPTVRTAPPKPVYNEQLQLPRSHPLSSPLGSPHASLASLQNLQQQLQQGPFGGGQQQQQQFGPFGGGGGGGLAYGGDSPLSQQDSGHFPYAAAAAAAGDPSLYAALDSLQVAGLTLGSSRGTSPTPRSPRGRHGGRGGVRSGAAAATTTGSEGRSNKAAGGSGALSSDALGGDLSAYLAASSTGLGQAPAWTVQDGGLINVGQAPAWTVQDGASRSLTSMTPAQWGALLCRPPVGLQQQPVGQQWKQQQQQLCLPVNSMPQQLAPAAAAAGGQITAGSTELQARLAAAASSPSYAHTLQQRGDTQGDHSPHSVFLGEKRVPNTSSLECRGAAEAAMQHLMWLQQQQQLQSEAACGQVGASDAATATGGGAGSGGGGRTVHMFNSSLDSSSTHLDVFSAAAVAAAASGGGDAAAAAAVFAGYDDDSMCAAAAMLGEFNPMDMELLLPFLNREDGGGGDGGGSGVNNNNNTRDDASGSVETVVSPTSKALDAVDEFFNLDLDVAALNRTAL